MAIDSGGPVFQPVRVKRGEAVNRRELMRRLTFQLHIPQRYGLRLLSAYEEVITDALMHGEGIKIPAAGTLTLEEYDSPMYRGFGKLQMRKMLFKYKWKVSRKAQKFLRYLSALKRKGRLDDYFS